MTIPSIITSSSLNVQLCLISCLTLYLVDGQCLMILYPFSSSTCILCCVVSYMSCIDIHVGISIVILMASMFSLMHYISLSLFSSLFCFDGPSAIFILGPGLYSMLILH